MSIAKELPGLISESLAAVIEAELNNLDDEQPATLGSVQESMMRGLAAILVAHARIPAEDEELVFAEMRNLIEEFGEDALAQNFISFRTSDDLATVIKAVLDSHGGDQAPTLATVRDAMNEGLVAHLVGMGEIDPDDDDVLPTEIERLIAHHGENEPAEDFLP
jgi:hypothetical protein